MKILRFEFEYFINLDWEIVRKDETGLFLEQTEKETKIAAVKDARKYIMNNWASIAIKFYLPSIFLQSVFIPDV